MKHLEHFDLLDNVNSSNIFEFNIHICCMLAIFIISIISFAFYHEKDDLPRIMVVILFSIAIFPAFYSII